MARTRNAVKRQQVATVESALFNPDVVCLLAALLDARDLCQVALTCKALGGKQAAYNGLSLVEEAARQTFERSATDWERSCLPKYDGEGWIELCHHLLMLRSKLTFDQLVGDYIEDSADQSIVHTIHGQISSPCSFSALCSNHVMRSGRHLAIFTQLSGNGGTMGVVRPVQINEADFGDSEQVNFFPGAQRFWNHLRDKRTGKWNDSNIHCCIVNTDGYFSWHDWINEQQFSRIDGFNRWAPIGLLLDLNEGTLSIYQDGNRLATLKEGLSGEYCWYASVSYDTSISIERGSITHEGAPS